MSLPAVFRLPLGAGLALLEARGCRLHPDLSHIGYIDRAIITARNACRRELLSHYRLVP